MAIDRPANEFIVGAAQELLDEVVGLRDRIGEQRESMRKSLEDEKDLVPLTKYAEVNIHIAQDLRNFIPKLHEFLPLCQALSSDTKPTCEGFTGVRLLQDPGPRLHPTVFEADEGLGIVQMLLRKIIESLEPAGGQDRTPLEKPDTVGQLARSQRKKPGPPPMTEQHQALAEIVQPYGVAWKDDLNLSRICKEADRRKVPVPKQWHPVRTWSGGFTKHKDKVLKVIASRLKTLQKLPQI